MLTNTAVHIYTGVSSPIVNIDIVGKVNKTCVPKAGKKG